MQQLNIAVIRYGAKDGAALDGLLARIAAQLSARGLKLAGAVQHNTDNGNRCRCDMTLQDLRSGRLIEISEKRGENARGCRLDQMALEEMVGLALAAVEADAQLLIVNKFGKHEGEGHGFRAAIEAAIDADIPVLVAVSDNNYPRWSDFVQGLDRELAKDEAAIVKWCIEAAGLGSGHAGSVDTPQMAAPLPG